MITIVDFATKLETFISLWRENIISDTEFVDNVRKLSDEVDLVANAVKNYHQSSPQD